MGGTGFVMTKTLVLLALFALVCLGGAAWCLGATVKVALGVMLIATTVICFIIFMGLTL